MPETAETTTVKTQKKTPKKKRSKTAAVDLYKTMRSKYAKDLRQLEYLEFTRDSLAYAVLGFDENGNQKTRLESNDLPPYEAEYLQPCFDVFSTYALDPGALDLPQSYAGRVTCVRFTFYRRKDSVKVRFICLREKSDGKYLKESTLQLWIPNEKNLISDAIVPDNVHAALENCRLVVLSIVDSDGRSVDRKFDEPSLPLDTEEPQPRAAVPTKAFDSSEDKELAQLTSPPSG